jgi:hypothetical protein
VRVGNLLEVYLASYMIGEDLYHLQAQVWIITIHIENLGPTNKKKQHTLIESMNQNQANKTSFDDRTSW